MTSEMVSLRTANKIKRRLFHLLLLVLSGILLHSALSKLTTTDATSGSHQGPGKHPVTSRKSTEKEAKEVAPAIADNKEDRRITINTKSTENEPKEGASRITDNKKGRHIGT